MEQGPLYSSDLSGEQWEDLLHDLSLQQANAVIYFAVDPYDIIEFCFPINPASSRSPDVLKISDAQVALTEVFYWRRRKPLLLPEYRKELKGVVEYFGREIDNIYSEAEILNRLYNEGDIKDILQSSSKEHEEIVQSNNKVVEIVQNHLNVLLAVAMGIYKIGTDRFAELYRQRLLMDHFEADLPEEKETLQKIFDGYRPSKLEKLIYSQVQKGTKLSGGSAVEREQKFRNVGEDARAIDRIIYLNSAFEDAFKRNELKKRYLILYLSSAPRTKAIFDIEAVKSALPIVAGRRFRFWRTREQLFAYVVHKSNKGNQAERLEESIQNIKKVKRLTEEIRNLDNVHFYCSQCLLFDGVPDDCISQSFCRDVMEASNRIKDERAKIKNLGLVNTLDGYEKMLANYTARNHHDFLEFFAKVCDSGIKDTALDRMRIKQELVFNWSEATSLFKEGFSFKDDNKELFIFRSPHDSVTGIDQILPTKPRLKSERYEKVLNLIFAYFKNPPQVGLLEEAYRQYLDISSVLRDPEQELIRCYLYLAFDKKQDEARAYQRIKQLISKDSIHKESWIRQEYRYVLCWAARRLGKFSEADECAKMALMEHADDPRIYHGLSLNIFAWLEHENDKCPYTRQDAIKFARQAIELYESDHSSNVEVIAANYNNLAYFFAQESAAQEDANLRLSSLLSAKTALMKLKELVDKNTWSPLHPEFFHTEAYLNYVDFIYSYTTGDKESLKAKLEEAKDNIDNAVRIYPDGPGYLGLKKSIEQGLNFIQR